MKISLSLLGVICLLGLGACRSYQVSVNDNVVYTPLPLFDQYEIADAALATCVQQTIEDKKITRANELTRLRCTHAGISDLTGLEKFSALQELDLSDNALRTIAPLARLGKLQWLSLRNNAVQQTAPLLTLIKLEMLDLSGNPDLPCEDMAQLRTAAVDNEGELIAPEHCAFP